MTQFQLLADCAGGGMYFWPYGGVVRQNTIFMVEGYARDQDWVLALNTSYPVYLKSGDEVVKLTVKETCVGQYDLTQAILIPESKLTAGKEYEMIIDNIPGYTMPLKTWNYKTSKYEPVKWKVLEGDDITKPAWTKKPDESKKTLIHFGCGPAVNVHFNFAVYDESPILLRTTVTNISSSKSTTYYLDATDLTTLGIGHDMCSGAFFYPEADTNFTIVFDIVDASGNVNPWALDPIAFTKPTDENSSEY
jgi:hypothetical protein